MLDVVSCATVACNYCMQHAVIIVFQHVGEPAIFAACCMQ